VCRNIKTLYHFEPPASMNEVRAAALQYVRKVSGFTNPSRANQASFDRAVDEIAQVTADLLGSLTTTGPARDRDEVAARARARAQARFGRTAGS